MTIEKEFLAEECGLDYDEYVSDDFSDVDEDILLNNDNKKIAAVSRSEAIDKKNDNKNDAASLPGESKTITKEDNY